MKRWLERVFGRPPATPSTPDGSRGDRAAAEAQRGRSAAYTEETTLSGVRVRVRHGGGVIALDRDPPFVERISPTLSLDLNDAFLSGSVLAAKAKAFDDGLYAAVELLVQGAGGKLALLEAMRATHPRVSAACDLGGGSPVAEGDDDARALKEQFLADELQSKPLAFYVWSDALSRVFRQDRILQAKVEEPAQLEPLVRAMFAAPEHRTAYERALRIAERLTNPLASVDLRPWLRALDVGASFEPTAPTSILPPSVAHETRLVAALFGDRPIPDGFDLANELMAAVRSGRLDLTPSSSSGWYDLQTWALETLITPERAEEARSLSLSAEYRKHLEALFRGLITLTRETHVKQLEIMAAGCAAPAPPKKEKLFLVPRLTVEPLVTFYARRAEGYRFVRALLEGELGEGALRSARRLTPEGSASVPLLEELERIERLFDGAAARARAELGLAAREPEVEAELARFERELGGDPDVGRDVRCMVPVYFDLARRKTKVWMFLGWTTGPVTAVYETPPEVEIVNPADRARYEVDFGWFTSTLAMPVMVEALTSRVLTRADFRRLCDEHAVGGAAAIVRAVESLA